MLLQKLTFTTKVVPWLNMVLIPLENQHDDREQLTQALNTLYGRNGLCFYFLIHKVFMLYLRAYVCAFEREVEVEVEGEGEGECTHGYIEAEYRCHQSPEESV